MSLRTLLALALVCLTFACSATPALEQSPQAPPSFRLVLPQGPGAILIDNSHGWRFERFVLYTDSGNSKRPVVQLRNEELGLVASYMLDHAPDYYDTSEACRNDVLGGVMHGALSKAEIKNQQDASRTVKSGQRLAIGTFFVAKQEGQRLDQQAVWGFFAQDHTCATIHLSRTPRSPAKNACLTPPSTASPTIRPMLPHRRTTPHLPSSCRPAWPRPMVPHRVHRTQTLRPEPWISLRSP